MRYQGAVYRPPSEADSYILQATLGCSHNACTFCGMYKDKPYRERSIEEIKEDIRLARILYGNVTKVFIADGDALALATEKLVEILRFLKQTFSQLKHIGIYAGPGSILNKEREELKLLQENGLNIAYLGIESGDPQLLQEIRKGFDPESITAAGKAVIDAGIRLSATVILGLAGRDRLRSERHARLTAEVCSSINPHYLSALTLMLVPKTVLYQKAQRGEFQLPGPFEILEELKTMVEGLDLKEPCIFRTNHASNYLPIKGTLPQDKKSILDLLNLVLRQRNGGILRPDYLRGL